jgi:nitroreductase
MSTQAKPSTDLLQFPLMQAILGRRSRRFGLGMELPSGPLAYKSRHDPVPLSEDEEAILIAAGTGVTGWNFGVPYGPGNPDEHGHFTVRYTGRTTATAAGIGTPVLFYTNDSGTYVTNTREVKPSRIAELDGDDPLEQVVKVCREHTTKLSDTRLDLPSAPGHVLDPNFWMANAPGSTLFMPVADASEEFLGMLCIFIAHGYVLMDDQEKRPAGDLDRFIQSGLLDADHKFPLSLLQQAAYEANCSELAFMAQNIVLTMQAIGLGGLYYNGFNRYSVLGAFAKDGIRGLGFRFTMEEGWSFPNPVGLDGVYEALCPPYYPDMRAAVEAFVERKFGPDGSYNPDAGGPWKDPGDMLGTVEPYSDEFVDCLAEIARYIHDKHGKFPGTFSTIVFPGVVQAQHLDTEFYDTHYQPGAYLETHAEHMQRWHPEHAG